MKFKCECGKVYTIPQVDWMMEKKKVCDCGCNVNGFKLIRMIVIWEPEAVPFFQ